MISHSFLLFLGLCQAVILPSKNLQTLVGGFNTPHDLKKVKMVDKSWIGVEKVYNGNPEDGPMLHKETNQIFRLSNFMYIGVKSKKFTWMMQTEWSAQRWSEHENKSFSNGKFDDPEAAAHASDTLARELMENGEQCHMLNFPDDKTKVYPEGVKATSCYFGVAYKITSAKWQARRRSKNENKVVSNGFYKNEKAAAHASDTLARALIRNGETGHILNFPEIVVYANQRQTTSCYIGVTYKITPGKWQAQRRSKHKDNTVYNGSYENEETAAHASDTLARKLIRSGETGHKLNFPDDETVVFPEKRNKRKRSDHQDSQIN